MDAAQSPEYLTRILWSRLQVLSSPKSGLMTFDIIAQVMLTRSLCPFFPRQQSAERCVSTLLDLIQTKVNYVVQEAIVVIRDIFRKYPNKYVLH